MSTKNQNQYLLSGMLLLQTFGLLVYTYITIQGEGLTVFESAIGFVQSMRWEGQFTLDFSCYLLLSVLWILWRNKFEVKSILIAFAAGIIGIMVFAPYLLVLLFQEEGDMKKVLIGDRL